MLAILLSRAAGLLGHIPLAAWLVAAIAAWGLHNSWQLNHTRAIAASNAIEANNVARETEHALTLKIGELSDDLHQAQINHVRAAAGASERLRHVATTYRATTSATAACSDDAAPAAAVLSDETREALVQLAADADTVSDQLRACQAYVSAVSAVSASHP